jgi:hypothetical protein
MDENFELLVNLDSSPIHRNGIILIPVSKAEQTILKLLKRNYQILGFDSFKLLEDNKIQPFIEFSHDYSYKVLNIEKIKNDLKEISPEITHIEIVFEIKH